MLSYLPAKALSGNSCRVKACQPHSASVGHIANKVVEGVPKERFMVDQKLAHFPSLQFVANSALAKAYLFTYLADGGNGPTILAPKSKRAKSNYLGDCMTRGFSSSVDDRHESDEGHALAGLTLTLGPTQRPSSPTRNQ